jgi:hypothetical protein
MKHALLGAIAGLLFGAGLAVSGMVHPGKVLAFLDVTGRWDPSLAAVMAGALVVTALGFHIARSRARPWLTDMFHWPTRNDIDAPLVGGAALFGIGWGLSGYCPGPALAGIALSPSTGLPFLGAMLLGSLLRRWTTQR